MLGRIRVQFDSMLVFCNMLVDLYSFLSYRSPTFVVLANQNVSPEVNKVRVCSNVRAHPETPPSAAV